MLTYTMTPDEEAYNVITRIYMKENKLFRKRHKKMILVCVLSLIVVAMSIAGMISNVHKNKEWIVFFAVGGILFFYGFLMLLFGAKKQVYRGIKQKAKSTEGMERTYSFGEDIRIHTEKTDSRISWDLIEAWGEFEHYLYLQYENSYILLDKNRMQEEMAARLKELVKAMV